MLVVTTSTILDHQMFSCWLDNFYKASQSSTYLLYAENEIKPDLSKNMSFLPSYIQTLKNFDQNSVISNLAVSNNGKANLLS